MTSGFKHGQQLLGTVVLESFKDAIHHLSKDAGAESPSIHPLRVTNGFAQTSLSFARKGDADVSSITFGCTDTGAMTVSMFNAAGPMNGPAVPADLTRDWVDLTVGRFVSTVLGRPMPE